MRIFKTFSIEAAHYLPHLPDEHKCRRLHGHSFRVEVHVSGEVGQSSGWVVDFAFIREAFRPLYEQLDHRCLNDIPGLENPTSENIARWIWERLAPSLPGLCRIAVQETAGAGCVYDGPDAGDAAASDAAGPGAGGAGMASGGGASDQSAAGGGGGDAAETPESPGASL